MTWDPQNRTPLLEPLQTALNAFNPTRRVTITCPESCVTDQSAKDECDINVIMARYLATGETPVLNRVEGQYFDVSEMDFHDHMNAIRASRELFDSLPARARDRFHNDPAEFLGFIEQPGNDLELAKLGLLNAETTATLLAQEEWAKNNPPVLDGE